MPVSTWTSSAPPLRSRASVATRRSRFRNQPEIKTELQADESGMSSRTRGRREGGTCSAASATASVGGERGKRKPAAAALPPNDEADIDDLNPPTKDRTATSPTCHAAGITAANTTSKLFDSQHGRAATPAEAEVNPPNEAKIETRSKTRTGGRKTLRTETTPKTERLKEVSSPEDVHPPTKKAKLGPKRSNLRSASKLNNEAGSSSGPPTPRARRSRERALLTGDGESAASTSSSVGKTVKAEKECSTTSSATGGRRRVVTKVKDEESNSTPRGRAGRAPRGREIVKVEGAAAAAATGGAARGPPPPNLMSKVSLIIQVMDVLYPEPPIPIDHKDHFTLLCGVLLSAQTTDAQVNLVTKELFKVAPDPLSMSKMSQEELQKIIRSVGLAPTKAKHLIALSQQLLDRFEGEVPSTHKALQSLPGVGRKTASVVMSQAFGIDTFPVDTHIHRLALRWGLTKDEKNPNRVEEDLMWAFPRRSWSKLHLQFIYFGREHCQARTHNASACPVCSWVKKTGPNAPKTLSEIGSLQKVLTSPTLPKKSNKNAIVYSERHLELEKFRMKVED